jgi:long-chain fatty acid transport protein
MEAKEALMARLSGRTAAGTVTALAVIAMAGEAAAGGFALKERSARAQGMSFAGATADSGDLSSMGFNPAAIGLIEDGGAMMGGLSLVLPKADGEVFAPGGVPTGEEVDADRPGGIANGYVGYRFAKDLLFGLSLYSPFGLRTEYEQTFTGAGDALESDLKTFVFAPTFAWEPIPELTLAGSFNVLYAEARLTSAGTILDGDETTASFAAGALWRPAPGTSIGLAYHHGYDLELNGFAQTPGVPVTLPASADAALPATVSLGITHEVTDDMRLAGEVQWQNWSVFDTIDVEVRTPFGTAALSDPQNYKDAFFVAVGGEYDATKKLTVRAGAAWDQTPTQDSNHAASKFGRTVRVPDEDRIWLSLGTTYDVTDRISIDAGYSFLFAPDDAVVELRTVPGSTVRYDGGAHIFSVGASFTF